MEGRGGGEPQGVADPPPQKKKNYNAMSSLVRLENKNVLFCFKKML
jgi:hypothetical protein